MEPKSLLLCSEIGCRLRGFGNTNIRYYYNLKMEAVRFTETPAPLYHSFCQNLQSCLLPRSEESAIGPYSAANLSGPHTNFLKTSFNYSPLVYI